MRINHRIFTTAGCVIAMTATSALAIPFGGIEFPDGAASFADAVLTYTPLHSGGPGPTDPDFMDPADALGPPDYVAPIGAVSLGRGGLIELEFLDNFLTNSGDADDDLHVFEVGPDVEDTFVAIRPTAATLLALGVGALDDDDGDGFFEVGKVFGATSSIDIDAFFPGFASGELLFDAVQLIDDFDEGGATGATVGADIDAVGAIASRPRMIDRTIPEPITATLGLMGLGSMLGMATRRRTA